MQILEGHANIISNLKIGIIKFDHKKVAIERGFAKISEKEVIVLSEGAVFPSEINKDKEIKIIEEINKKIINTDKNDYEKLLTLNNLLKTSKIKLELLN